MEQVHQIKIECLLFVDVLGSFQIGHKDPDHQLFDGGLDPCDSFPVDLSFIATLLLQL